MLVVKKLIFLESTYKHVYNNNVFLDTLNYPPKNQKALSLLIYLEKKIENEKFS